jgi:hypothetical protein
MCRRKLGDAHSVSTGEHFKLEQQQQQQQQQHSLCSAAIVILCMGSSKSHLTKTYAIAQFRSMFTSC